MPKIHQPPIRVFHFSGKAYQAGIIEHELDGVKVKIYDREKTVADCFKFRERIGMDVALEAVKDYLRQPKVNVSLLMKYARINRVEKIIHTSVCGGVAVKITEPTFYFPFQLSTL